MSKTNKSLILGAAMAGLILGSAPVQAAQSAPSDAGYVATKADEKKDVALLQRQELLQGQWRLQVRRQRLQRQELLQGQGRLQHCACQVIQPSIIDPRRHTCRRGTFLDPSCQPIRSTASPTTASASACAFRITRTSSRRNRSSTGLRSSRKISWSTAAGRWRCSTRFSSSTAWCSTASRCTSAIADRPSREHLKRLKTLVKRTKTPWLSDHLCWGSVDGRYTHDLLPMPVHLRGGEAHGAEDPRGARLSRDSDLRGKRQQLRGVPRLGNDRVGIPQRGHRSWPTAAFCST